MDELMSKAKKHVRDFLRGASQAFFLENAWFGAALLAVLAVFGPRMLIYGAACAAMNYILSVRYSTPRPLKGGGLITINGFFFGISMAALFETSPSFHFALIVGALMVPLVTKATYEVLGHWKLSPFVFPYILTVWIMWLCSSQMGLAINAHAWSDWVSPPTGIRSDVDLQHVVDAILLSLGRMVFLPNAAFGAAILGLVTVFSPRRGAFLLLGVSVATLAGILLSPGTPWDAGYFSYSAGLVGLGLAASAERFAIRTILLLSVFSSFLTLALFKLLSGLGLPALSLPYVATMWLAALSRVPRLSLSWAPRVSEATALVTPRLAPTVQQPEKAA
jgi:urea transporter